MEARRATGGDVPRPQDAEAVARRRQRRLVVHDIPPEIDHHLAGVGEYVELRALDRHAEVARPGDAQPALGRAQLGWEHDRPMHRVAAIGRTEHAEQEGDVVDRCDPWGRAR